MVDEDERGGTCFQICYNPVLDSKGEVTRLVVLAVDVTRRWHFERHAVEVRGLAHVGAEGVLGEEVAGGHVEVSDGHEILL